MFTWSRAAFSHLPNSSDSSSTSAQAHSWVATVRTVRVVGPHCPHLPFPQTSEPANMEECGPREEALLMGGGLQEGRHRS